MVVMVPLPHYYETEVSRRCVIGDVAAIDVRMGVGGLNVERQRLNRPRSVFKFDTQK